MEIGDTILNMGASGENIYNRFGTIISDGYNLSSDNGGGFLTAATDHINSDPRLAALANNGGPTLTHALLPGSPAIDQGKRDAIPSLAFDFDQRGFPRPVDDPSVVNAVGGDASDIGAYEAQPTAAILQFIPDSPTLSPTTFSARLTGPSGSSAVIEVSSNLFSWTAIQTNALPAGNADLSLPFNGELYRFFRARLAQGF